MNRITKRIFSLLMTLAMIFGTLPTALIARAEDGTSDDQSNNGQTEYELLGDMNQNGEIAVSDVVDLRDMIMRGTPTASQINFGDVVELRDMIMKGSTAVVAVKKIFENFINRKFLCKII